MIGGTEDRRSTMTGGALMSRRLVPLLFGVVLAASLAMVWQLTREVRSLRTSVVRARQRAVLPRTGQYVPPLQTATMAGDSIALAADDGQRRVLLYFTSTCAFCRAEVKSWQALAERLRARGLDPATTMVAVSFDSSDAAAIRYASERGWTFPVVRIADPRMRALYRGVAVPATVVVNGDGNVGFARTGTIGSTAGLDSVILAFTQPAVQPTTDPMTIAGNR
jgi:peroxiredoxin